MGKGAEPPLSHGFVGGLHDSLSGQSLTQRWHRAQVSPSAPRCPGEGQRIRNPHPSSSLLVPHRSCQRPHRLLNHHAKTQRALNGWEGEMWRRQRQKFVTLLQKEQNPESSSLTSRKDTTENIPREGDSVCGAPTRAFTQLSSGGLIRVLQCPLVTALSLHPE